MRLRRVDYEQRGVGSLISVPTFANLIATVGRERKDKRRMGPGGGRENPSVVPDTLELHVDGGITNDNCFGAPFGPQRAFEFEGIAVPLVRDLEYRPKCDRDAEYDDKLAAAVAFAARGISHAESLRGHVAVANRGDGVTCVEKALRAQDAGARALIIVDDVPANAKRKPHTVDWGTAHQRTPSTLEWHEKIGEEGEEKEGTRCRRQRIFASEATGPSACIPLTPIVLADPDTLHGTGADGDTWCGALNEATATLYAGKVVLVKRGGRKVKLAQEPREFAAKAKIAQDRGAVAVVIYNNKDGRGSAVKMNLASWYQEAAGAERLRIPVIMIDFAHGKALRAAINSDCAGVTITPGGDAAAAQALAEQVRIPVVMVAKSAGTWLGDGARVAIRSEPNIYYTREAMGALQAVAEDHMMRLYAAAGAVAQSSGRIVLWPHDLDLATRLGRHSDMCGRH